MADEPIVIPVRADTEDAERGFKRVSSGLRDVSRVGVAAIAGLTGAITAASAAIKGLADSTTGYIDKVNTLAKSSGMANQTIAGMNLAAQATGKSLEQLVPKDLAKRLLEVEQGGAGAIASFKELGLTQSDVIALNGDVDAAYRIIIDRLQGIDSEGRRAAVATQLLGENGGQMLSAFGSSAELDFFVQRAEKFGIDVGPEAVKQTSAWQKANADLALALEAVQAQFTPLIGPAATQIDRVAKGMVFLVGVTKGWSRSLAEARDIFQQLKSGNLMALFEGDQTGVFDWLREGIKEYKEFAGLVEAGTPAIEEAVTSGIEEPTRRVATTIRTKTIPAVKELANELRSAGDGAQTLFGQNLIAGADALNLKISALREAAQAASVQVAMASAFGITTTEMQVEAEKTTFTQRQKMRDKNLSQDLAAANSAASMIQQQTNFALQHINTRTKAGKAAAIALFATQKAAAIAQAVMNTALAISSALTIPPPPVGIALAAVMGALGAVQVGVIAAEQPKFHIGSRATDSGPDEFQALLRRNEKVVTAVGDEAMTSSKTGDFNAGISGGGGGVSLIMMDHRAAGQVVSSQLRAGTRLMRATRQGEPRGHSRKRGTRGV